MNDIKEKMKIEDLIKFERYKFERYKYEFFLQNEILFHTSAEILSLAGKITHMIINIPDLSDDEKVDYLTEFIISIEKQHSNLQWRIPLQCINHAEFLTLWGVGRQLLYSDEDGNKEETRVLHRKLLNRKEIRYILSFINGCD
jgi:hypothetical protein